MKKKTSVKIQEKYDLILDPFVADLIDSLDVARTARVPRLSEFVDKVTSGTARSRCPQEISYNEYCNAFMSATIEALSGDEIESEFLHMAFALMEGYNLEDGIVRRRELYADQTTDLDLSKNSIDRSCREREDFLIYYLCVRIAREYKNNSPHCYYPSEIKPYFTPIERTIREKTYLTRKNQKKQPLDNYNQNPEQSASEEQSKTASAQEMPPDTVKSAVVEDFEAFSTEELAVAKKLGLPIDQTDPLLVDVYKMAIAKEIAHPRSIKRQTASVLSDLSPEELLQFMQVAGGSFAVIDNRGSTIKDGLFTRYSNVISPEQIVFDARGLSDVMPVRKNWKTDANYEHLENHIMLDELGLLKPWARRPITEALVLYDGSHNVLKIVPKNEFQKTFLFSSAELTLAGKEILSAFGTPFSEEDLIDIGLYFRYFYKGGYIVNLYRVERRDDKIVYLLNPEMEDVISTSEEEDFLHCPDFLDYFQTIWIMAHLIEYFHGRKLDEGDSLSSREFLIWIMRTFGTIQSNSLPPQLIIYPTLFDDHPELIPHFENLVRGVETDDEVIQAAMDIFEQYPEFHAKAQLLRNPVWEVNIY